MVRPSNAVLTFINVLTLILSVSAVAYSLWLPTHNDYSLCQKVIQKPLLILGLSVFFLSFIGLIGSLCRISFLVWIYLFFLFVFLFGLFILTIFTIAVTNKGVGKVVSGRGYKEYRLGDYSSWLQKYVGNEKHWDGIKSCLVDLHFCQRLEGNNRVDEFYRHGLSPIEAGCCKPPSYCGFQFQNATVWTPPNLGPAAPDTDCNTWSNNQRKLCFDCNSCKAGVLANIKGFWWNLTIIYFIIICITIIVCSLGCCALRNNRMDGYKRYKGYP